MSAEKKINTLGYVRPSKYRKTKCGKAELSQDIPDPELLDSSTHEVITDEMLQNEPVFESDEQIYTPSDWFEDIFGETESICDDALDCDESCINDSVDDGNDDDDELGEDEFVTKGHHLTIHNSLLMIWLYATTFSITGVQLSALLSLIALHISTNNSAYSSLYRFRKYFSSCKSPLKKHLYCTFCSRLLDSANDAVCGNAKCRKDLSGLGSLDYFMEIPLEDQLQTLFSRKEFVTALETRLDNRRNKASGNIEDISDGSVYKQFCVNNGPLSHHFPYNISLTLNTDGVAVFKSSKKSVWPIYLVINELPYNLRFKKSNMILAGMWFSDKKPIFNIFASHLRKTLIKFENEGFLVSINSKVQNVRAFLICITADLPARSNLLNMVQFNGSCSCTYCLQTGENFRTKKGGNVRVFPYQTNDPDGPKRTKDSIIKDIGIAFNENKTSNGIRGPSFLFNLSSFASFSQVSIDYMHGALLGISKLLIGLWFSSSHSSSNFSLYKSVTLVDERLSTIRPTCTISRLPRSISEHFKFWKAAELRSWLLFYSVPVMSDIMAPIYLYHYCAFVDSIFLLTKDCITEGDLVDAHRMLCYFVYMFKDLYGERYITLNIHSLVHLADCVRSLGPLWAHSCFPFENANGDLKNYFHGTQSVDLQMVNAIHVTQKLPSLFNALPDEDSLTAFITSLKPEWSKAQNRSIIFTLGKGYKKRIPDVLFGDVIFILKHNVRRLTFYNRIKLRGRIFQSKDYSRVTLRNSFTVKYINKDSQMQFGFICWYAQDSENSNVTVACINKAEKIDSQLFRGVNNFLNLKIGHIHCVRKPIVEEFEIVNVDNIMCLCICVECGNNTYVCEEPNYKEINL